MKQRLVGTLVLGCLAIILIPLLLDGSGIQPPPLSATIPPEPVFNETPIEEPTRPVIVADSLPAPGVEAAVSANDDTQQLPAFDPGDSSDKARPATPDALEAAVAAVIARKDSASEVQADATPKLDSSGLPLAFVVRLGSFSDKANADALVSRLLAAGNKAYARQVSTQGGSMTAVYVGPVPTRAEANSLVTQLAGNFQLSGVVESFTTAAR